MSRSGAETASRSDGGQKNYRAFPTIYRNSGACSSRRHRHLTVSCRSAILEGVSPLARRFHAIGLMLALAASSGAACAGWAPTPEARMSCCTDGGSCPMHERDAHQSPITQAQADACCASSEPDPSNQSSPTLVVLSSAVLGPGVVVPETAPALVLSDAWRPAAPIPLTHVPRHVLLSVFLV